MLGPQPIKIGGYSHVAKFDAVNLNRWQLYDEIAFINMEIVINIFLFVRSWHPTLKSM